MSSATTARVCGVLHRSPALVLVLGGVGDGRAVGRDYFDALLAAFAHHVGGLLAAAEVEVLGRADAAQLYPGDPGGPDGCYLACAQARILQAEGRGRGPQPLLDLVGGVRKLAHGVVLLCGLVVRSIVYPEG